MRDDLRDAMPPALSHDPAVMQSPNQSRRPLSVTDRELEVLAAFLTGGEQGAAEAVGVARSTIKNTLSRIRVKTGARSTAHAAYLLAHRLRAGAVARPALPPEPGEHGRQ